MNLEETLAAIRPVDQGLRAAAKRRMDTKTKPLGSLGALEELAVRMALIQGRLDPSVSSKASFVFAADHGVAEEGVSAFPAAVTPQMVLNFLGGGAAINVLCRHYGIEMRVVDMGVDFDFPPGGALLHKKVRRGTRNFLKEDALTRAEAVSALEGGIAVFEEAFAHKPIDLVGLGDMGIGNTASATAIIAAATGKPVGPLTGRGTGVDDAGLSKKIRVIENALTLRRPAGNDGLDILSKVGGLEIAGIAGCALAAARLGRAVMLDGIISTAAGLVAYLLQPAVKDYLFIGHRSVERGQEAACEILGLAPIVDLGMRLGEGTGAAVAMDLVEAACRIMDEMASFESAGVSEKGA